MSVKNTKSPYATRREYRTPRGTSQWRRRASKRASTRNGLDSAKSETSHPGVSSLRFGRLAIRPVVVGLLVLAASVAQAKQPEVPPPHRHLHVTFSQLDWHAVDGVTVAFDTLWGAVDYEHAQVRGSDPVPKRVRVVR
jgi:hypothetical protein